MQRFFNNWRFYFFLDNISPPIINNKNNYKAGIMTGKFVLQLKVKIEQIIHIKKIR